MHTCLSHDSHYCTAVDLMYCERADVLYCVTVASLKWKSVKKRALL